MKVLIQLAWERFDDWCREQRIQRWGKIAAEMLRTGGQEHARTVMAPLKAESGLRSGVQIDRMERKKRLKR